LHITELRELFDDAAPYLIARSPIFLCDRLLGFWLEYHTPIAAAIGTVFRQKPGVTKRISHRFDLTSFIPINRSNRHKFDLKSMASRQQEILSLKSESIVRFVQIWEQFVRAILKPHWLSKTFRRHSLLICHDMNLFVHRRIAGILVAGIIAQTLFLVA